jgi:membrane protein
VFARDWLVRFVELQGFDRGVALGAQAFTALFPLLIVYSSVVSASTGRDVADRLIEAFSLSGTAAQSLREAFAAPSSVESEISALGVILLVASALSFTRALQRLYQLSWQQSSLGLRAMPWGLTWLALAVLVVTIRPPLVAGVHGVGRIVISLLLAGVVWFVSPYVLLGRRVRWRRLLPGAALSALGMTALSVASAVWMPRSVATASLHYGVIGVAFALLSWLVAAGIVLVVASAGGALIDERLRGAEDPSRAVH